MEIEWMFGIRLEMEVPRTGQDATNAKKFEEDATGTMFAVDGPPSRAGIPDAKKDSPAYIKEAEKQWREKGTDSPFFKRWFRGSKVVDGEGKPRVVYHGTARAGFDDFDTYGANYGLMGQGQYFTESPAIASGYTRKGVAGMRRRGETPTEGVYPVYLDIKRPMDMDAPADVRAWKRAAGEYLDTSEVSAGATNEQVLRLIEREMVGEVPRYEAWEMVQEAVQGQGFDGITHMGGGRVGQGERHRVWIAFDPEQIKSATGNRGTFDSSNPDIRYAVDPAGESRKGQGETIEVRGDEIPGFAQARRAVREDGRPDYGAMRKVVRDWAKEHLVGKTIRNQESEHDVAITSGGIDHGLTNRATPQQMAATYKLADLIRKGKVISSTADVKDRPGIVAVHTLESAVNVEGRPYLARITVHENNAGDWLYAYRLRKKEGPQGNAAGPLELRPLRPQDNTIGRQDQQVKENPDTKYAVGGTAQPATVGLSEAQGTRREAATPETPGQKVQGLWDKVRRRVEDEFLPVRRKVESLKKGGGAVEDSSDTGMKLDLYHGKVGDDYRHVESSYVEPLIKTMTEGGIMQDQLDAYLLRQSG